MSLAESITTLTACHTPSKVIGQVEVGTQYSLPLAEKSVGCCFRAGSESRSVQTTETVDQSSATSGLTNAMSLAESITATMACLAPSKVIGEVEVGTQCSLPLADKSVGCSFKAGSESRSVQTIETVDQSSSSSAGYRYARLSRFNNQSSSVVSSTAATDGTNTTSLSTSNLTKASKRRNYRRSTMEKKATIIRQMQSHQSQVDVTKEFEIAKQAMAEYLINKVKILEATGKSAGCRCKNVSQGACPKIEEAILM
ncbi:uncharacterized protein [Dermacentor albipictus]|uniref:uncharacterized protein isoform X5 n=1 Tax=Dermacentor albipictus TaxID=60249 RepID=UPI0031FDC722